MSFQTLSTDTLAALINALNLRVEHHVMYGNPSFYEIKPMAHKHMSLKESYKPYGAEHGGHTFYQQRVGKDQAGVGRAQEKLKRNELFGIYYPNRSGSLKLHISLNDIANIDDKVLQGLIKLLIEESESPKNNANFDFKIIRPEKLDARFADNDQFTLYFDKYSSAADLVRLAEKIEAYLHEQGVQSNPKALGPKDSFGFNSFVSARFDTNKLLNKYDIYPFFDIELGKFFTKFSLEQIEHIPICAFEAVFDYIIMGEDIEHLSNTPTIGLSESDSLKVQLELEKMMANPKEYMNGIDLETDETLRESYQKKQERISADDLAFISRQAPDLYNQLQQMITKSIQLGNTEKGKITGNLYNDLALQYLHFRRHRISYDQFKTNSSGMIRDAQKVLEVHRGWKEIFVNVLAIIVSLGGTAFWQLYKTDGEHCFFTVNTESININERTLECIDELKPLP